MEGHGADGILDICECLFISYGPWLFISALEALLPLPPNVVSVGRYQVLWRYCFDMVPCGKFFGPRRY